ncbi:MAG: phage major capsid protein [Alphaproteobacteria bacterium]|nr:phage major capsid protein [Alphaproteobacteria bacterium]
MTPAQKKLKELRERQSRERQRMAELGIADSLTDETRAELDAIEAGTPDLERQLRAAQTAVEQEETEQRTEARTEAPDAEMRERIELRGKASLGTFLAAAAKGRLPDGPEAELIAAAGLRAGQIPLELWDVPQPESERREQRDVTPAPGTVGVNLDPIRPAVFANAILPRLGVEMPRVESGTYATGTITGSQSAAALAKSAAAVGTVGAITVTTATPKRVSARLELTLEDIATVGQANFESILRENLSLALSDELDNQGLNGDGSAPNLSGLFQALTDPSDPTAIADFDAFAAAHAGGVDGLWANTIREVGIVVGADTYRLSARTFQTATNYKGEMSAAAYAMANAGGWWTNKRMPDAAATIQQAILYRMGRSMMGGAGAMRTAVCPHWNAIDIDDIYSGSAKGERYFTMHVLLGDVIVVQPDAYTQTAFKVA